MMKTPQGKATRGENQRNENSPARPSEDISEQGDEHCSYLIILKVSLQTARPGKGGFAKAQTCGRADETDDRGGDRNNHRVEEPCPAKSSS